MRRLDDTLQAPQLDLGLLRVLIVEDDALVRERLSLLINQAGYAVACACSVREARELIEKEFFPIAIVDRMLGDGDGVGLCAELRQQASQGYIYILLLTARDSSDEIVRGLEAGADDYLSKKITDQELLARMRSATRIVKLEQSLRRALEDRTRAADTDTLTRGYNRRYFSRQIGLEWRRAMRFNQRLSLLLLDIDHFKSVNDRYGHAAGDEVLKEFWRRMHEGLPRAFDWAARVGGEEFVIVLPETDIVGALVVAERVRATVEGTAIQTSAGLVSITVSVGVSSIASLPANQEPSVEALLDQADALLYRSKLAGRNRVTVPDETLTG